MLSHQNRTSEENTSSSGGERSRRMGSRPGDGCSQAGSDRQPCASNRVKKDAIESRTVKQGDGEGTEG